MRRSAYTLVEVVIVVTIAGLVMMITVPRGRAVLDRIAVRAAAGDIISTLATARTYALAGRSSVSIEVDSVSGVLRVKRGEEILLARNLGQAHGVRLAKSRDSLTYDGRGLGRGAANLSIVVRLRSAAETVFVSRMGRVR